MSVTMHAAISNSPRSSVRTSTRYASTDAQLADVARAVRIVDDETVLVRGRTHRCSDVPVPGDVACLLTEATASLIYSELYARPRPRGAIDASDRAFVASLASANDGTGTWEPGWRICGLAGDRMVVTRGSLCVYASSHELLAPHGLGVGAPCRVRVGRELRNASPGFYMVIGNGDADATPPPLLADRQLVRVYANVAASGARCFVAGVTSRLNARRLPFRAKILATPSAFSRADAAVIYLRRDDYLASVPLLADLADELRNEVVDEVPLFALRVAPGFAVAEDPGGGASFGQHRSHAVAIALVATRGRSAAARIAAIKAAFFRAGIDVTRPHLNRGSPDVYAEW